MQEPEIPDNEAERLQVLKSLEILDTDPEEIFDRVTRLAIRLFEVPIALISLVDANRQWFKAKVGLDVAETSRSISFCGHSILQDEMLVIEDATRDERFSDNPLVTGSLHLRFYAGRPLSVAGVRVGTFCLIDARPRTLSASDVSHIQDMADLVQDQMALRYKESKRQVSGLIKDQFIANLSHELRTPANALLGSLHQMQESGREGDRYDENGSCKRPALKIAISAAESINGLLAYLVDLSQIESGNFELNKNGFDLASLCDEIRTLVLNECEAKGLSLRVDIDDNLPAEFIGDAPKIKQVILNLLTNAIRYTQVGGVVLGVSGSPTRDEKQFQLFIKVEDSGIGLSSEARLHIFEPYHREKQSKHLAVEGRGLGLSISRQLAGTMDGEILVESDGQSGSIFTFKLVLPIARDRGGRQVDLIDGLSVDGSYVPRILLVEDSKLNRSVIEAMLDKLPIRLSSAEDGEQAMELAQTTRFDLVLMDVGLPGMDGYECTRRLRALPDQHKFAVVAITAQALKGDRERMIDAGFDDYLPKPFRKKALISKISENLEVSTSIAGESEN